MAKPRKKFPDRPFPYHHELELEITTLTNLGVGLGRVRLPARADSAAIPTAKPEIENSQGWVVMVPFTLPGERVRARVFRNHPNFSEADLLAVLAPSPHRIAASCPLFGRCGGCQYQHLSYPEQLVWKRRQVEELLQHLAGIEFPVAPVIPSPRELGYRSKITPHFQLRGNAAEREHPDSVPIGFLKQSSRFELVDVPHCPIATPEINAKLTEVRARVRREIAAGDYDRGATLLLRHAQEGVITDYDAVIHELVAPAPFPPLSPASDLAAPSPPALADNSGNHLSINEKSVIVANSNNDALTSSALRLHFLARDFFQNNPFILPAFTGYVRKEAAGSGARFLVDAYCGSGLFALACAPAFARVAGIEISETSIKFARENAAANGIANATFRAGDAAQIFAGLDFAPGETAVVIDPPRKGCDESFLRQLFEFGPRAVVYVSCDPATQMRDLAHFLSAGYELRAVQPFDLFPQTRHLECVMTLAKR